MQINDKIDISIYDNIFDLFDIIEFPDKEQILNGLPKGYMFSNMTNTYLSAFINELNIFHSIMIRRYKILREDFDPSSQPVDETCWEDCVENTIKFIKTEPHCTIDNIPGLPDDIIILAEGDDDCYWLLWNDRGGHTCDIGRIPNSICTKQELIDCLHRSVPNIGYNYEEYVVLPRFLGWITL